MISTGTSNFLFVYRKLSSCISNLQKLTKSGMAYEDAWNATSVQLVALAEVQLTKLHMLNNNK